MKVARTRRPASAVKSVAKKSAAKKPGLSVSIDYPEEGGSVKPGHYSIRLTAAGADRAQIRLSGGEWSDCREAVGHFWLDWAPVPGPARIEARARSGKGRWSAVPARDCVVEG